VVAVPAVARVVVVCPETLLLPRPEAVQHIATALYFREPAVEVVAVATRAGNTSISLAWSSRVHAR
jgi:hypothetical protein